MDTKEINDMARNLQVGDRFYYTGDMANIDSFGVVIARHEDPRWGLHYDVKFDVDGHVNKMLSFASFTAAPGQRFKTMVQYEAERQEQIARWEAHYGKKAR